jgi:outer membrane beta-barrel protein
MVISMVTRKNDTSRFQKDIFIGFTEVIFLFALALSTFTPRGMAAPPTANPMTPTPATSEAKKVDVNTLKTRYWNNSAPETSVVQNRIYKKAHRLSLNVDYFIMSHDSFLTTTGVGGSLGYNFSEEFGLHFLYWKISEGSSSAVASLEAAEQKSGGTIYSPNSNPISSIIGGEVSWSVLYGKLSLLGKAILHFDFFLLGGGGIVKAQNGNSTAYWAGLGQQVYLTHYLAFRVDYRMMFYAENIVETNNVQTRGAFLERRNVNAPSFTLGFTFYF